MESGMISISDVRISTGDVISMRDKDTRQERLHETLLQASEPITGTDLSLQLGVTRQVVVHDIALLRAQGTKIVSTPRGYWIPTMQEPFGKYILSVSHPPTLTEVELYTLVDFGIRVIDVSVEHPVYGELTGSLHLSSRRDVELFLEKVRDSRASLLSSLTDGYHVHTVEAPDVARFHEAIAQLRRHGIQVLD
jgi:transcriptional regulator of NAD metabolism